MTAKYQTSIAVVCLFAVLSLLAGQMSSNLIQLPFSDFIDHVCISNMTPCFLPSLSYVSSPEFMQGMQLSYLPNGRVSNVTFTEKIAVNFCRATKNYVSCYANMTKLCINGSYLGMDLQQLTGRIVDLYDVCDRPDFYVNVMILKDCILSLYNNPRSMRAVESCSEEIQRDSRRFTQQFALSQEVMMQKLKSGELLTELNRLTDQMMTCITPIFMTCSPQAQILIQNVFFDAMAMRNASISMAVVTMPMMGGIFSMLL